MVENLSLGPQGTCPLAPVTQFDVPLTLSEQRKVGIRGSRRSNLPGEGELMSLGFTPEGGRELVSRAARLMALSPDYSIHCAFDFE